MKENKKEEQAAQEKNARVIVERLREESGQEAARILAAAEAQARQIVEDASAEAEQKRAQARERMREEAQRIRERVFSSLNLEKKRIVLEEKDNFIRQVLGQTRELAGQFRVKPGYDDFLLRAVTEGAKVVGGTDLEVAYAADDEKIFLTGSFIIRLESLCQEVLKKTITFRYTRGDFDEPGVIVSSVDGRIQFDNRFSARLSRLEKEIYARLLRES